jgi:hypothetical protein
LTLEHRAEKCGPVFRDNDAKTKTQSQSRDPQYRAPISRDGLWNGDLPALACVGGATRAVSAA